MRADSESSTRGGLGVRISVRPALDLLAFGCERHDAVNSREYAVVAFAGTE